MAGTLSLIWGKIIHDLTLFEGPVRVGEISYEAFLNGEETPRMKEERLHTEKAGYTSNESEAQVNRES